MKNFNESLRIGESLILNNKELKLNHHSTSGRIIGEVTMEEYDKSGNMIFSETDINDVTLPGSIFVLEQIFKKGSNSHRFLHKNQLPTGQYGETSTGVLKSVENDSLDWNSINSIEFGDIDNYIMNEHIFGFMVGHGGETSSSIVAPKYEASTLTNSLGNSSFIPMRILDMNNNSFDPLDDGINYYIKLKDGDINYYYAKGFSSEPKIYTKWSDGSGNVQGDQLDYDIPILTYAELVINIDEKDIREYFSELSSEQCYINQLGLVAGKPIWTEDSEGTYIKNGDIYVPVDSSDPTTDRYRKDFDDVKLVTTINFKSKDLSNDENKLKFIYKVYCL